MISMLKRTLLAIAIAAFTLRLGYAAASGALQRPQTWEYEGIATNLIEHQTFLYQSDSGDYLSYAEPLYPFLAAAVYFLTNHNFTVLVLLQLLIAAASVWMTGYATHLATRDDLTASAAAMVMAVHPGFIRYSSILHPLVLDAFFFAAAAAVLVRYRQQPTRAYGLVAAGVIGLGALTRPTILLFLAPLGWMAWRSRHSFARSMQRTALLTATALAIVAPWTIRNAVVHREFVLTRSGTGLVFWLGHNPHASGGAIDTKGRPLVANLSPDIQRRIHASDELTRDRIYSHMAWQHIRANPLAAIGRVVQRIYYFWWFSPQWGLNFSPVTKLVYFGWWTLLLLLIATGLAASRHLPRRGDLWLLGALALLISIGQSVYYVEGRHRLAVEPLVVPLAAAGLTSIRRRKPATTSTQNVFR